MNAQKTASALLAPLLLLSCGGGGDDCASTGIFEASEVTVSAEQSGRIIRLDLTEGDTLSSGSPVGLLDTVQTHLLSLQLLASMQSLASQRPDIDKQTAPLRRQLATAQTEVNRFEALVKDNAANQKQLDDARASASLLASQLEAQLSSLALATDALNSQILATDIQRQQALDRLAKCRITAPLSGVVLDKYAEQGEYAVPGTPLFKMAPTDRLFLRAYVTSAQLQSIRLGQAATVLADYGSGHRDEYPGTVTWIASQAEFTPKTILTDDERADLVYAVKIAVNNDGRIKIGMYGEVRFLPPP